LLQNTCHVAAETPLAVRRSGIARFLAAIMRGQLHAPSLQCDAKLTALSILPSLVQQKLRRDVATDSIDALLDSGMVGALVQSAATANTDAGEDRVSTSIRTLCQLCLCTFGATVNGAAALVGDVGDEDGGDGNDVGRGFALVQELLVGPALNSEVNASVNDPEHPSVYENVAVRALTDICLLWPEAKRLATPTCVAKLVSMITTDADAASRVHALTALINLSAGHTSREHAELLPPAHVWCLPRASGADSMTPCRLTLMEHGRVECAAGSIIAAGALTSLLELLASADLPMADVHLCLLTLCNLVRWSKRAAEFIAAADFSVALFTRLLFETADGASEGSTKLVLVNVISMSFVTSHQLSELEAAGAEPLMELCAYDEVSARCPRLLRNESTPLLCASSYPRPSSTSTHTPNSASRYFWAGWHSHAQRACKTAARNCRQPAVARFATTAAAASARSSHRTRTRTRTRVTADCSIVAFLVAYLRAKWLTNNRSSLLPHTLLPRTCSSASSIGAARRPAQVLSRTEPVHGLRRVESEHRATAVCQVHNLLSS
jgi:hypothetical protein